MPAQFTIPLQTVIPGQLITSALWNNEFENLDNNLIPSGIDDASVSDGAFETDVDPYPGSVISRPTTLEGELHRLRYQVRAITGEAKWQNRPEKTIEQLVAKDVTLDAAILAVIPAGTAMLFYQANAPAGWSAVAVSGKFLQVVAAGGSGGTTAGSGLTPSSTIVLNHSHAVSSHTHDLGNHTHTGPSHTHSVSNDGWGSFGAGVEGRITTQAAYASTNGINTGSGGTGNTGAPSSNTSGAASSTTDGQLTSIGFQYANVIVATKN